MQRFAAVLLVCTLIITASPAKAIERDDFHFRAGVMLGFRLFDSNQDLYKGDLTQIRNYSDTPEHAPMGGFFVGADFRMFTLEAMFEYLPTSMDESNRSATSYAWTLGVIYRIPFKLWKFTPYFKLEGGDILLSVEGAGTDSDRQMGMGGGVFFPVYKKWFGRVEAMGQMTDGYDNSFAKNMTLRAGIGYRWGFNNDRDGDGIINRKDKCPDNPEDFDKFEDVDGCPEPDNDNDGVKDKKDKCPGTIADKADNFAKTKEDQDGFMDSDGCPDPDNDGDSILDGKDKCPGKDADKETQFSNTKEDMDGFEDSDGCPEHDNDKDGVPDKTDKCPGTEADKKNDFVNTKEDTDGFSDLDGCPDRDNDSDGIPDKTDKCPGKDQDAKNGFIKTKETINGFKDSDGCPDSGKPQVIVVKKKINILGKIYFKFDHAKILKRSYSLLNQVALTLKANKDIQLVEIQGHAGTYGREETNIKLSGSRAKAVRRYLIRRGIAASRLISKWYGITQPLKDCNDVKKLSKRKRCEAVNRRVQFKILKRK
jgi:outer membrane protein OmpA-like peptidoglycan-associated protein